jgi:hypothetical protein
MPPVKFFESLDLDPICLFLDGHLLDLTLIFLLMVFWPIGHHRLVLVCVRPCGSVANLLFCHGHTRTHTDTVFIQPAAENISQLSTQHFSLLLYQHTRLPAIWVLGSVSSLELFRSPAMSLSAHRLFSLSALITFFPSA